MSHFFFHLTINKSIIDNLLKESFQKWKEDTYFETAQNGIGDTSFGTEGVVKTSSLTHNKKRTKSLHSRKGTACIA